MKSALELFRGELERLFLSVNLRDLCRKYLDIDCPKKKVIYLTRTRPSSFVASSIGARKTTRPRPWPTSC